LRNDKITAIIQYCSVIKCVNFIILLSCISEMLINIFGLSVCASDGHVVVLCANEGT